MKYSIFAFPVLLLCVLSRVSAGSRSSILLGQLDLHTAGPGQTYVNNTDTTVAVLSFSQLGLNATTTVHGALTAAGFLSVDPPANPRDASERFELRVGDFGVDLSVYSDLFIFGAVVRGYDGPSRIAVSSSTDDFASSEELEFPAGMATDFSVRVTTGGRLPAGGVTVRFTAASAAGNLSSPDNYLGFANSLAYGRFLVYASPKRCPVGSASGCVHGARAKVARVTSEDHVTLGVIDHGPFGVYECTATGAGAGAGAVHAAVPAERSLKVVCECTCFELPPDAEFDVCVPGTLSGGHALAGTVCAGGTVTSAAGAATYAACDTIDGDLRLTFPSLEAVEFPRVRHITGELVLENKVLSLKMPLLETIGGNVLVGTAYLTSLETPRLRSLCGAGLLVQSTQVPSVQVPMLGGTAAFIVITDTVTPLLDIDLGSVGGGPTQLTGSDSASSSCVLCVKGRSASEKIGRLSGLAALREVRSTAYQNDYVSLSRLSEVTSLDFLRHTNLGGEAGAHQDVKLSLSTSSFAAQGHFESDGTWRVAHLMVVNVYGLLSFKVPGLCGSSWSLLQVRSNQGMSAVDLGSVAGGPREISLESNLFLAGHSTSPLTTVLGLTSLERVRTVSVVREVSFEWLEPGAFAAPLLNAAYGEGAERLKIRIYRCVAPATLSFEFLTDLDSLYVSSVSGMTSFGLPRLASDEVASLLVSGNADLTHVDLGSVGGGPIAIRSATESILLRLEGQGSSRITSIDGLTRLTTFESGANRDGQVILRYITTSTLPAAVLSASFSTGAAAASLVVQDLTLSGGELVWPGVVDVRRIDANRVAGATAIRFPNLATSTMSRINAISNADTTLLDFGSVGGGPSRIVHPAEAWAAPLDIRGKSPTLVTTILGLDNVSEVACVDDPSAHLCTTRFTALATLPLNLLSALNTRGRQPLSIYVQANSFPTPIAFDLPNVTDARMVLAEDNTGIPALRMPYLNTTSMQQLQVEGNIDFHSVDAGSVGGGPQELTGGADGNAASLRLRGSASHVIENVTGLSNLVRVSSYANKWNYVDLAYLGTGTSSLQEVLSDLQFAGGANRLRLIVEQTPFTELRFTNVPALYSLRVINNANLGVLRFSGTPANSIDEAVIQGNTALPDGCATAIDPLAVSFSTSGSPSGACPV
eukprot:TRINITY_DN6980_c0_g3_i2.p1 TRINITY_DN6980_c0_g3~~TRINITY_DN6980_c0_g3_i2.p1  ORF type:complete len:1156 (-),score=220.07 TRINITY_DN6980_c0_g3_i2:133-3600(-)